MAANEFEGQVQQKMDELKLTPSAGVWEKVEAQIKKEKKRKALFLFLLLFLFLSTGGLFLTNEAHKELHALQKNELINSSIFSGTKGPVDINERSSGFSDKSKPGPVTELRNKKTGPSVNKYDARDIPAPKSPFVINRTKAPNIVGSHNKYKFSQQNGEAGDVVANSEEIKKSKEATVVTDIDEIDSANPVDKKTAIQKDSTSLSISAKSIKDINTDSSIKIIKDTSKAKPDDKNKTKESKWDFAIQVGLGMSATGNSFLTTDNNDNSLSSTVTPSGPTAGGISYHPAPAKMSWAFKAGVSGIYHISKKLALSAGLTYKLYSTVIATGPKFDSLSFAIYPTGTNISYHNYYHFIDIPVEFQYRLGTNANLPIFAFGGINISQLIYTNALQFDFARGIYYRDNSLFHKTGIGISGGLLFDVFQKKKIPLQVGPDFYYSLSGISGSGLYSGKHYSYVGLRFQKILGKK